MILIETFYQNKPGEIVTTKTETVFAINYWKTTSKVLLYFQNEDFKVILCQKYENFGFNPLVYLYEDKQTLAY